VTIVIVKRCTECCSVDGLRYKFLLTHYWLEANLSLMAASLSAKFSNGKLVWISSSPQQHEDCKLSQASYDMDCYFASFQSVSEILHWWTVCKIFDRLIVQFDRVLLLGSPWFYKQYYDTLRLSNHPWQYTRKQLDHCKLPIAHLSKINLRDKLLFSGKIHLCVSLFSSPFINDSLVLTFILQAEQKSAALVHLEKIWTLLLADSIKLLRGYVYSKMRCCNTHMQTLLECFKD